MFEVQRVKTPAVERAMVEDARRKVARHGIAGAAYVSPAEVVALVSWIDRLEANPDATDGVIVPLPVLGSIS